MDRCLFSDPGELNEGVGMFDFVAAIQVGVLLITGGGFGQPSQSSDDWDLAADPARNLTIASVDYASGVSLSVQCFDGGLSVGLVGLPAFAATVRQLERRFDDGRHETWYFEPATGNGLVAHNIRYARAFRAEGGLVLTAAPDGAPPVQIRLDLPAQSTHLDQVLSACGKALTSRFDTALDVGTLLLAAPGIEVPPSALDRHDLIQIVLDCLIVDSRLASCESESQTPQDTAAGDATARATNGKRVRVSDPAAAEGRWVQIVVTGNRIRRPVR